MLSTAVLFSTIFSVPINGQEGGEPKAVASDKTYRAMVGFQTDQYGFSDSTLRMPVRRSQSFQTLSSNLYMYALGTKSSEALLQDIPEASHHLPG